MGNTLRDLATHVKSVRNARFALQAAEREQAEFVLANSKELLDRGIVSIRVREGVLFQQMEREQGKESVFRAMDA